MSEARTLSGEVELLRGGPRLVPAGCAACHEVFLVGSDKLGRPCPACHQDELASQEARVAPVEPEMFVAFALSEEDVSDRLSEWVRSFWFRIGDLQEDRLGGRLERVWVPLWLVDVTVDGNWQNQVGYDYEVQSTIETFSNGSWSSKDVTETKIRWEPRAGTVVRRVEDVPTRALSHQEDVEKLAGALAPSDAQRGVPGKILEDAVVWLPDLRPEAAWPVAEQNVKQTVAAQIRAAVGSQHVRETYFSVDYLGKNWTWLFVPIYTTWYTDGDTRYTVYINGQTGQIGGPRIASNTKGLIWAGVIVTIAACIGAVGVVIAAVGVVVPPLLVLAGILVVLAFLICLVALWPALKPWLWNRSQWALQPLQEETPRDSS